MSSLRERFSILPFSSTIYWNPKTTRSLQTQDEYDNLTQKIILLLRGEKEDEIWFQFQCVEKNKDNESKKVDMYLVPEIELNPGNKTIKDLLALIPPNIMDLYKDYMENKTRRENFCALLFSMLHPLPNNNNNYDLKSFFLVPRQIQVLYINYLMDLLL